MKILANNIIAKTPFNRPGGKPMLALIWVCFFWGTTWIASKEGVRYIPAIQMCAIRQILGGSIYLLYFLYTKHPWPKGKQWVTILILSALNFMLSNTLTTWGVKYISSGLGAIIAAIMPLWIVIFTLFEGNRLPGKALAGMLLGFGGICIIFYDHLKDFLNADFRFGILLSFIASISWALGSLYTKKHSSGFNPYFSMGLQMVISSVALFSITYTTGDMINLHDIPMNGWLAVSYLVVFGSVLSFIAYVYVLQHLPTSRASIYAYSNPVVAVLLGALIFNERLNIYVAIGGAVTIAGVYLVNDSFKRNIVANK
jgi:drug/metabolite transporter (DMT)-like permease